MTNLVCKKCGQNVEVGPELSICPHCQNDLKRQIVSTINVADIAPDKQINIMGSIDTADNAGGQTALPPGAEIDADLGKESNKTIQAADRGYAEIPEFSATQKSSMGSVYDSVDLSSAIPPRTIGTSAKPGDLNDYRILGEPLGEGSFGVVYKALQVPLDRTVALKLLKERQQPGEQESKQSKKDRQQRRIAAKNEFLREAQFTGKLEHPNIVPVHDIGLTKEENSEGNRPFYVMKEIKGDSWQDSIHQKTRTENLEIFKRVVDAVGFAHDQNILHCDLKPENVMLGDFGEVLLVDWGQAIDMTRLEMYRPGGSPAYVSPEMARFWCDLHLDHKPTSTAISEVGRQSDVYVLGAILFEIVTGNPPHFGLKGETAHDVMRRASENQIRNYEEFKDDELMQIALVALREIEGERFENVEQFQEALKAYESQRLSIELRDRAEELLAFAKTNNDYDSYQKSRFGFEESLENWKGNTASKVGLQDARLSCAELALADQNFDLGIGMLEHPETTKEHELLKQLRDGKRKRDGRQKLIRRLSLLFAFVTILGVTVALSLLTWAWNEQETAKKATIVAASEAKRAAVEADRAAYESVMSIFAQQDAESANEEAEQAIKVADEADLEADRAYEQSFLASWNAELAKMDADEALAEADLADTEVTISMVEALLAQNDAADAASKADEALIQKNLIEQSSKFLKSKGKVTSINQKLQSGSFAEARNLLTKTSLNLESEKTPWEIARLNLQSHPEVSIVDSIKDEISFAASSGDCSRLAFILPDRIVVHETSNFANRLEIPYIGATSVALSKSGNLMAVGSPSPDLSDLTSSGFIQILELNDLTNLPVAGPRIAAQSVSISDLQFSADSSKLLSVGAISKIRRAAQLDVENNLQYAEEPLMVWQNQAGNWTLTTVDIGRNQLKLSRAAFSPDGQKILTTNPQATGDDLVVNVFHLEQQAGDDPKDVFKHQYSVPDPNDATSENNLEINVAIWDQDSNKIIACNRERLTNSFQLLELETVSQDSLAAANLSQSFVNASFISNEALRPQLLTQLDSKVQFIERLGNGGYITTGDDKKVTIWTQGEGNLTSTQHFGGHSRSIDFCCLFGGKEESGRISGGTLLSLSSGENPEILITDLATYVDEIETVRITNRANENSGSSPVSFFRSPVTERTALGNNQGLAAIKLPDGKTVKWEVSAWKRQYLTDQHLFAVSRRDAIYQFNRQTGTLEKVLTKLAHSKPMTELKVSDDGKTAVTRYQDDEVNLYVWDLENEVNTRTIHTQNSIDELGSSTIGNNLELPELTLSPDGKWIVASKIRNFVWSTSTGEIREDLLATQVNRSRTIPNSIFFTGDSSKLAQSWANQVDVFDLASGTRNSYPTTAEIVKTLDASFTDGKLRLLAISVPDETDDSGDGVTEVVGSNIRLMEIGSDSETLAEFKNAKFARFGKLNQDEVLVLNKNVKDVEPVERVNWRSGASQPLKIMDQLRTPFAGESDSSKHKNRFAILETIDESGDGTIVVQSSTRNVRTVVERDWNTVSFTKDLEIGALRVLAKPTVEYAGIVGDRAITLSSGGLIQFWKITGGLVQPDGRLPGNFTYCQLSPDEKTLMAISMDGSKIVSVEPGTGNELFQVNSIAANQPSALAWANDSKRFAVGYATGDVSIFKLENNNQTEEPGIKGAGRIRTMAFSKNGASLLVISDDAARVFHEFKGDETNEDGQSVNVHNWDRKVKVAHIDGKTITAGDISEDGSRIVTGAENGRLTVWNTSTNVAMTGDDTSDAQDSSTVRELLNLDEIYQAPVQILKFVENNGEVELYTSSKGESNRLSIWKTSGQLLD